MGKGLRGGEAGALLAYMPAYALRVPVLHRHEEPTPAVFNGEDPEAVSAPQDIGDIGGDLLLVNS